MTSVLKTIDAKGRLTLGQAFAGKLVEVAFEDEGDAIVLHVRRVVPEREAWLWENAAASVAVERGLQQARDGELGDGPDLSTAFAFADTLADEE